MSQLKDFFDKRRIEQLASEMAGVYPAFSQQAFVDAAIAGFAEQELMDRGKAVARALRTFLPQDVPEAIRIVVAALGPAAGHVDGNGMGPFHYLPHAWFMAFYGVDHVEAGLAAQREITQRFSCEFSIRPFLEQEFERTYAELEVWSRDPNEHIRRLVSEGTRPRLPWASRLVRFQKDPNLGLALLERLRDDPSLYVRRSVANHLNDIGKDHPQVLIDVCREWIKDAPEPRRWVIDHALRHRIKLGDKDALAILGFGGDSAVTVTKATFDPPVVAIGGSVLVTLELHAAKSERVVVDLSVGFVKADKKARAKVFKVSELDVAAGDKVTVRKRISLAVHTTRQPYPGVHKVAVLLNGDATPIGAFTVTA